MATVYFFFLFLPKKIIRVISFLSSIPDYNRYPAFSPTAWSIETPIYNGDGHLFRVSR